MKKLITMMAAAALGAFAWADTDFDGTGSLTYTVSSDFEDGVTNIVGYADNAQTSVFNSGDVYWWATNYPTASAEKETYEQPIEVATETINNESKKVFKIETDAATPLLRTFNKTIGTETPTGSGSGVYTFTRDPQSIADNGLFADSMIKLSASEEPPSTCNGKIAVWLQVIPAEDPSDENLEGIAGSTNLMVTCGVVNQDTYEVSGTTNIVISAEGVEIAPDTWHQVTIRTIKTIKDGKYVPGFVIWVDGELAKAAAGAYELPTVDGKGARFNALNALFASASSDVGEATTLDSVGFAGSGALRRIDLLDAYNAPEFAIDPTYVQIAWNEGVTAFTINGQKIEVEGIGSTNIAVALPTRQTSVEIIPEFLTEPAYKLVGFKLNGGDPFVGDGKAQFSVARFSENTLDIVAVQDRQGVSISYKKAGDEEFSQLCAPTPFLKDAIAAIMAAQEVDDGLEAGDTVKIVLLTNEVAETTGDWSGISPNIILDLNGFKLSASEDWTGGYSEHTEEDDPATAYGNTAVIYNIGNLTIVDNSEAGGGEIAGTNSVGAIVNVAKLVIKAATGTNPMKFTGGVATLNDGDGCNGEVDIYGGKFKPKATLNNEPVDFTGTGLKWSDEDDAGYYEVVDDEEPPTPAGTVIIIAGDGTPKGQYETLAAAIGAAGAGDTVTLTENLTLTETLAIAKATAINLAGKTLTLSGDATGIKITVDGVAITNGTIASSLTANAAMSKAIEVAYANATFKDLTINAGHYEYAIYANCDEEAAKDRPTQRAQLEWIYALTSFKKLDCDSVTITGNGSLFHVEGMEATLNNCSATGSGSDLFSNAAHQAAVYSAVNARTTITGSGTYTHVNALQSGNLGGKITVAEGSTAEFTGNIKSYMKMGAHSELESNPNYKAVFAFNAGAYTDSIVFDDADARTLDSFTKGTAVAITAPTGYTWLNDTTLTKVYTITWADSENIVVSNGTAQVGETSGSYAKGTVLKFYATVGAITNVTVDGVTQEVANPFEYTVGEAAAAIIVLAGEDQPDTPWTPDEEAKIIEGNIPSDKADAVKANLDKIAAALGATTGGEAAAVEAWVADAYGQDGKIPVAKLAPATDAQIAVATLNDLPLTTAEPTFEVSASTVSADTNVAAFEFTLKDGSDAVEIKTLTAKVKAMVKYTEALGTTTPFAQAQENTDVTITLTTGDEGTAGKIKVELIKKTDVNAGFMKVEPQKPTPAEL